MQLIDLKSKNGKAYQVSLPEPIPSLKSKFVFAFAKSGSTLLDNMITTYCAQLNVPTFSLYNQAFGQGVPTHLIDNDSICCFKDVGYIYTGFRHFPHFELDTADARIIWLVRDPRDMLVSLYFSLAKSHVIPDGMDGMQKRREQVASFTIDNFAKTNFTPFIEQYQRYRDQLDNREVKIYRYEDVIYKKEKWFKDVIRFLELPYEKELMRTVVAQFDIIPEQEEQSAHIRQVHPGNYKKKLAPETITLLNRELSEFLDYFNYKK